MWSNRVTVIMVSVSIGGPAARLRREAGSAHQSLLLHVDQVVEHLVHGRDDLGVGLEAALRDDHVGELVGQVHVGLLQVAGADLAQAAAGRRADLGRPELMVAWKLLPPPRCRPAGLGKSVSAIWPRVRV